MVPLFSTQHKEGKHFLFLKKKEAIIPSLRALWKIDLVNWLNIIKTVHVPFHIPMYNMYYHILQGLLNINIILDLMLLYSELC